MKMLRIVIARLIRKIKEKFYVEQIMKKNKLHSVFKSIIIVALTIFILFTIISYETLKYSYSNQNKIYEDGYLASSYANKINEDVLNMRMCSLAYLINHDQSIAAKLKTYGKDIEENINKYELLHNLTDEEENIIDQLTKINMRYRDNVKKIINNISESKTVQDYEIREMLSFGDTSIELSKELIDYSNSHVNMLNNKSKEIKNLAMYTIIIINFTMIALFALMMFVAIKMNKKIEYCAFYSSTTGLPNKNYVFNRLAKDISKMHKDKYTILISLDIDNFKAVNDTLGHSSGDEFLKQVGTRFRRLISIKDYVYHIGGDEFLFLIRSVNNRAEAEIIVKKIQNVFKEPFYIEGKEIDYVTPSLGVVDVNQDGKDFEELYNCADDAMYASKRLGKNRYSFYDKEMYSDVYENTVKKKSIEEGLQKGEFKVFYQPKVSNEEKFLGAEALVRWIKDDNKIIPPSEFIEFAENEGLIKYIGEVVIIEVCKKISEWIGKGYKNFRIAINLSAEQLISEKLCDKALKIIEEFEIPFEYIEFEVTESTIIKDFNVAIKNIKKIRSYGIKVSLDDFGTGYSSLNYLKELSIDSVKIDKSFIDNIGFEDASNVMVNYIIKICHYFGYGIVAEGVEKKEQIECLKDLGCDVFQGYYFGKPMNEISFENEFLV
jgi:diguanylate cyclase (GGDEF)-like protein